VWVTRRFLYGLDVLAGIDLQLRRTCLGSNIFSSIPSSGWLLLTGHPDARTSINGQPIQRTFLRNGDTIEIGAAKIQFWLSESHQGAASSRMADMGRDRRFLLPIGVISCCFRYGESVSKVLTPVNRHCGHLRSLRLAITPHHALSAR